MFINHNVTGMDSNQSIEVEKENMDDDDDVQILETPLSQTTQGTDSFLDKGGKTEKSAKSKNTREGELVDGRDAKKPKSDVWPYFETPTIVDGVEKCKCKHCHKFLTC